MTDDQFKIEKHQVFAGVQLMYAEVHREKVHFPYRDNTEGDALMITHCREGCMECEIDGTLINLAEGDMLITRSDLGYSNVYFPLMHFRGITVSFSGNEVSADMSPYLDDADSLLAAIKCRFCEKSSAFVARSVPSIEHVFAELYSVPDEIMERYLKIKVSELLLFLCVFDPEQNVFLNHFHSKTQLMLAKKIDHYISSHIDEKLTLKKLSEHFHISGSQIKDAFKSVYDVSPGTYIRTRKMESAAYMLEHTDKSILEIAMEHGFDSGSSFARSFSEVQGMTPKKYRKLHWKING